MTTRTTHRARRAGAVPAPDALDMARDYGAVEYRATLLERQRDEARARLAQRQRPHWTQRPVVVGLCLLVFVAVGISFAPRFYAWRYGVDLTKPAAEQPMPTAGRPPRPTSPPRQEAPGGAESGAPLAAPDYGVAAYNAAQQERAEAFATEDQQADEAAINAWLEAPVSTSTPLPQPGEEGFAESFQEASQCSPFVGYLPGDPCIPELTAIAAGE